MRCCYHCGSMRLFAIAGADGEFKCKVCGRTQGGVLVQDAHPENDAVHHPSHYANGMMVELECIMFKRWLPGDLSDAFKYVWRDGDKDDPVQDLEKAVWYLDDALEYGITFNEPKLVPFLPKSSLPEWKYRALRCILTDRLSDARQIIVEQLHGMTATAQNDRKH